MRDFDFLEPTTIAEASRMLADCGDQCRLLAGGTALMLVLRQRIVNPTHVVSLGKVQELRGITFDPNEDLRIGAFTVHADIARSPLVRQHFPMLADMASRLANPQVRNQGTLGGNLCFGDPATDPPSCLIALDAQVVLKSAAGSRAMKLDDFIVDYYQTALQPGEILTEVRVPVTRFNAGYHTRFLRTAAEHRPLVNLALSAQRDQAHCLDLRMVVGAATAKPTRLVRAEALLRGKAVTRELAIAAAEQAAAGIDPISDIRGDASFRRDMVRVVARRTIEDVFGLAERSEQRVA
jgi:aerobic carbon-monoxide dehydrogenase medium subunit